MLKPLLPLGLIASALLFSACSHAPLKHEGLFKIQENGKTGFINASGKLVITPQFATAEDFSEGLAQVSLPEKPALFGYIDITGKMVISPRFTETHEFSEGLALVEAEGKSVFIDKTGKVILKPELKPLRGFAKGLAVAGSIGTFGFIDRSGKTVIKGQYTYADSFSEGLAAVYIGGHPVPCMFPDGQFVSLSGGRWEYIDKAGDSIIKAPASLPQIVNEEGFSSGLALVRMADTGKYGYLNQKGDVAFPAQFDYARPFSEGLALVGTGGKDDERRTSAQYCPSWSYQGGKYGYIDTGGRTVIKPQFDGASSFSGGLATVRINGSIGYIDTSGNLAIKPQFRTANPFSDGLAYACAEKCGYINTSGKFVWTEAK